MSEGYPLSREEKIDAILTIVGAAPVHFDKLRGNFEHLSDELIDRQYRDCLAIKPYFDEWQHNRVAGNDHGKQKPESGGNPQAS